jgi:hypothetical protein
MSSFLAAIQAAAASYMPAARARAELERAEARELLDVEDPRLYDESYAARMRLADMRELTDFRGRARKARAMHLVPEFEALQARITRCKAEQRAQSIAHAPPEECAPLNKRRAALGAEKAELMRKLVRGGA